MANYGSSPTWAEVWAQLVYKGVMPRDIVFNACCRNAPNFIDAIDETDNPTEGDAGAARRRALADMRRKLSEALSYPARVVENCIFDFRKLIGSSAQTIEDAKRDLYDYFIANSLRVKSRGLTRGTITAGSVTGNYQMIDFTYDDEGFLIERGGPFAPGTEWTYNIEVVKDSGEIGIEGRCGLRCYSTGTPAVDRCVDSQGISAAVEFESIDSRNSILGNSDFRQFASSKFTNWWDAAGTYTAVTQETTSTNAHMALRGTRSPTNQSGTYSTLLLGVGSPKLFQYVSAALKDDRPYLCWAWVKAGGTADGTLTLTLGSKSYVWTPPDTNYHLIYIGLTTEKNAYWRNFRDNPLSVGIQRTGGFSAGTIYVDQIGLCEVPAYFNGRWLACVESTTEMDEEDYWTVTDSIGADPGTTQNELALDHDFHLPHAAVATSTTEDYA